MIWSALQWQIQGEFRGFAPPFPLLNILWNRNNLVTMRPNYFFHRIFKINEIKSTKRNQYLLYIWTPFPGILDWPLHQNDYLENLLIWMIQTAALLPYVSLLFHKKQICFFVLWILFVCLFCCFTSHVNSYGHWGTVSSPNHTSSWAGLNKRLTSNSCTYFRL